MKETKNPVIGIIGGTGKMGQWFKHFFEEFNIPVLISGRNTPLTTKELIKKSDIVIVSVPISETQKIIKDVIPLMLRHQLLTDFTSFKVMPEEAMKDASCATLGMHPLFGQTASIEQGLQIVFCKHKESPLITFLEKLFKTANIEVVYISEEQHDYHMAYTQAFTHAINLLYSKIIFEQKNVLENKLHTPLFTLQSLVMGRVLYQDMKLIGDLQLYNPYFLPMLEAFIEQAKQLEKIIEKNDEEAFHKMFNQEQQLSKNFSSFTILQTNRILQQVNSLTVTLPTKIKKATLSKKANIGYLGPEGTFSNLAVETIFPQKEHIKNAYGTLFDVFTATQNSTIDLGVVPAENSTEGTVRETLDYLIDFSLTILGSFELPIHQQLLSLEKKLQDIHTIVSHPQALAQCKRWLQENMPEVKLISATSTTASLEKPQKGYGYIASELASRRYKLKIIALNIEDNPQNTTKFYIIAKNNISLSGINNKKTVVFITVYNRVGILRDILDVFAKHNMNLTKLESRPSKTRTWDYHFFIEFEKANVNASIDDTLKDLQKFCQIIRVLGKT